MSNVGQDIQRVKGPSHPVLHLFIPLVYSPLAPEITTNCSGKYNFIVVSHDLCILAEIN